MPKRVHLVLKTHHDALKMLSKAKGQRFKIIMENTPEMVKAIQVLFRYILNSRLKLQDKHVNKLKPHRNYIRKIARASHKAIKRTVQTGGSIFSEILSTVLPLIPALL